MFVAKGSIFEGPNGRAKTDVKDPHGETILAVRGNSVSWTRPAELDLDHLEESPDAAIFVDGSTRELNRDLDPTILRAAITIAGGEKSTLSEVPKSPNIEQLLP